MSRLLLPPLLPGAAISLVAPASWPAPAAVALACERVQRLGFLVRTYRDFPTPTRYLAGTDDERAREFEAAIADPDTSMILAVRGGYGVTRMLSHVNLSGLARRPKIVCGYSDLTALHAAVQRRTGLVTVHGPNLVNGLGGDPDESAIEIDALMALVAHGVGEGWSLCPAACRDRLRCVASGTGDGPLVGGNLAVLAALVGTPDEPAYDGCVLFLEDTGEAPYRIDRMVTQLLAAGRLDRVAGVVLGYFSEPGEAASPTAAEVLGELLATLGVPILAGFPAGHEHPNAPLPMGGMVSLDSGAKSLTLLGPIVDRPTA
ncbi:MAG: S66 peptidase family protein [Lacipirellulaceae bacterium]